MIKFILWIKTSFEDGNGSVSHRKLTVFFFSMMVLLMIILTYKRNNPHLFPEFVWLSVIAGAYGMSYLRKKSIEDEIKSKINNTINSNSIDITDDDVLHRDVENSTGSGEGKKSSRKK